VGKFLLLAFRNVFRNRRRTVMTLLMVGGGVTGLLLAGGFFAFMTHGLRESTINDGLGHMQIFTADHFNRDEVRVLDTGIDNWRRGRRNVSGRPARARRRSPHRVLRHGLERRPRPQSSWAAPSIPLPKRAWIHAAPRFGARSRPKPGGEVEALVGVGLAKSMNVKVGDGLTILAVTSDGALNGVDVQIVGIVNSGSRTGRRAICASRCPPRSACCKAIASPISWSDSTTENTDARLQCRSAPRLARPASADGAEEMDRPGHLLQAGAQHVCGIFLFLGSSCSSWC
jgi:hypothetical protein